MPDLGKLPSSLRELATFESIAGVPALIGHPSGFDARVPMVLWMHGRTANKELDPGRYLRWLRAGIGMVSVDLPGHGARDDAPRHGPNQTLGVVGEMLAEVDGIVREALERFGHAFDADRLGIGGMSAGGMVTLRRLCEPHPFKAAAIEGTCGSLSELYGPDRPISTESDAAELARLDTSEHLREFAPIPLLALHSEADELVPWPVQQAFLQKLSGHYRERGSDASLIEITTWPQTGAPLEHSGFGRMGSQAKNIQTDFFMRHLLG